MTKTAHRPGVVWKDEPDAHDYPAATSYLSLLAPPDVVTATVAAFDAATAAHFKAKDILRASRLDLLDVDNPHVAIDLRKIKDGVALSPVLLVRGDLTRGRAAQIADGYHRVCASYHTDENTDVPVRILDLVTPADDARPGAARSGTARSGTAQPGVSQPGVSQDAAQLGTPR